MQNSCLKTSAWWSRGSHFVENGYLSLRFPNMVKVNIHEHWTRVTRFNPLWVSALIDLRFCKLWSCKFNKQKLIIPHTCLFEESGFILKTGQFTPLHARGFMRTFLSTQMPKVTGQIWLPTCTCKLVKVIVQLTKTWKNCESFAAPLVTPGFNEHEICVSRQLIQWVGRRFLFRFRLTLSYCIVNVIGNKKTNWQH